MAGDSRRGGDGALCQPHPRPALLPQLWADLVRSQQSRGYVDQAQKRTTLTQQVQVSYMLEFPDLT